jgi:hypothetical protein
MLHIPQLPKNDDQLVFTDRGTRNIWASSPPQIRGEPSVTHIQQPIAQSVLVICSLGPHHYPCNCCEELLSHSPNTAFRFQQLRPSQLPHYVSLQISAYIVFLRLNYATPYGVTAPAWTSLCQSSDRVQCLADISIVATGFKLF